MKTKQFKYQQVREKILQKISSGELKADQRLPSERDLARQWGMSALTVGKALTQLEKEGYLDRRVGDGTYVQADANGASPHTGSGPASPELHADVNRYVMMLINDLSYGFIPHITHLIEERFTRLGYHIIIKSLHHDFEEALQVIDTIEHENFGGIIFNPIYSLLYEYENTELCRRIERLGKPFMMIDSYLKNYPCPYVVTDNYKGGYDATRFLIEKGHRRIALLWADRDSATMDRIRGYQQALEDHGIFGDENLMLRCRYKDAINSGTNPCDPLFENVFADQRRPTAVFTLDDYLAHFTLLHCQSHGIRVPEDLAIVGFDDFLPSQITTMKQDMESLADHAVQMFIDITSGRPPRQEHVHVPPRLIERNSA